MPHLLRKQARQARAQATVLAISQATAHIIEAHGLDQLTTNTIADRAGVSIGSLYQYFPNKEAILANLIREKRAAILEGLRVAAKIGKDQPPEQAIEILIRAGMAWQLTSPRLTRVLEQLQFDLSLQSETAVFRDEMARITLESIQRVAPNAGLQEAQDVIIITKGLILSAMESGTSGREVLCMRACKAAMGYLTYQA